jgi:hypothetical protein
VFFWFVCGVGLHRWLLNLETAGIVAYRQGDNAQFGSIRQAGPIALSLRNGSDFVPVILQALYLVFPVLAPATTLGMVD